MATLLYRMPRVAFHTLGCKLNMAETSSLRRAFEDRAFEVVPFGDAADVAVVNTCSVTAEADRKCRQVIRRALRANPSACIVVTGCYAQLQPEAVGSIDGVDVVLGTHEKARLFEFIDTFEKRARTQVHVSCIDDRDEFDPARLAADRTRAFLKVQDGCDYSCSFCTIPLARGKSRSGPAELLLAQAQELAARGVREVVLTGVNVGLYGQDLEDESSLLDLLRALSGIDKIKRWRISSIEPNLLTDEVIDFVAESRAFVPHFHVPLQSGDDGVLGAMRRRYRRGRWADRVQRIIDYMPDACIGADVIVGFPAETEERFENTVAFLSDLPIAYLHAFTYSERPNTAAVDVPHRMGGRPVAHTVRACRNRRLRRLSDRKRRTFYERHVGQMRPVLWERPKKRDALHGFTDNYIRVRRPYDEARIGSVETVRLGPIGSDGALKAA